ncbi:hypothetical protein NQ314_008889 [Rhamnusium bicolor]|uniref:Uncharacterized protein n=1 Tax=Rhamnusium bicolor TaxID=1586634 RepID=A0AAV8Y4P3_9CUCU|nr:hypothetical protein NQ314_008889 [Rhamnusium bicolor]
MQVLGRKLATTKIDSQYQVKVQSHHNGFSTLISRYVILEITGKLQEFSFKALELAIPKHIRLADPWFSKASRNDMLIGADCF